MKMKDVLSQKVAAQNLDRQLQKLAADLTLNYLVDSFDDFYSVVYGGLKKVAGTNKKITKYLLPLALLGAGLYNIYGTPGVGAKQVGVGKWQVLYRPKYSLFENPDLAAVLEAPNPDLAKHNNRLVDAIVYELSKEKSTNIGSNMYHPLDQIDFSNLSE